MPISRRRLLISALGAACLPYMPSQFICAQGNGNGRVNRLAAATIGIDTHNHVDVPLVADELPGPSIDLAGELKRSGLAAVCMTFATDYQPGDAYQRFLTGFAAFDRQLERNGMTRALKPADIAAAHAQGKPAAVQSVEGGHFLQGRIGRVQEAYERGLRHLRLLHDSDAIVPLGDVYTNPPRFGGLTAFGAEVLRECNRLGIVVDLAHANVQTTEAALKVAKRPVLISHTGLDTRLGDNMRMAQMMRPRLIGEAQAKAVASAGGAIGVWTHLADTPLEYAKNLRAMASVVGVDHVCIGTDTKLTTPAPRMFGPPPGEKLKGEMRMPPTGSLAHAGERTNQAWAGMSDGFYPVVIDAMLRVGFSESDIGKIGGENFLRIFSEAANV